jgi:hypothetical protein
MIVVSSMLADKETNTYHNFKKYAILLIGLKIYVCLQYSDAIKPELILL